MPAAPSPAVTASPAVLPVAVPSHAAGIGLAALGFGLFTCMDTTIKWLSGGYPLSQIIFFNAAFALWPILLVTHRTGGLGRLRTRRLPVHVMRGLTSLAGGFGAFFAYSRMPLADAYAVAFTAPLFITALSVPVLGEQVGWRRWSAVAVGFLGVMVMLRPGAGMLEIGILGILVGALGHAVSVLTVRRFGATESGTAFAFYGNLTAIAITGAMLPFQFVMPSLGDLALFAACGTASGFGVSALFGALQRTPAAIVAPFQYTQMVWGVLFGYLIWHDMPEPPVLVGAAIVILSGLYILHREAYRGRSVATSAPGVGAK